ncbi:FecR family protein [Flavihumibacter sp. UBA7668]|uniref:FecR family protein n=1 Tax=Flavihumibacter sp. UBA7668 TaxID=1946542 RepID=UPI0025BE3204|nr:FecR family protein [Flavihumibacter sp. UBA7668]
MQTKEELKNAIREGIESRIKAHKRKQERKLFAGISLAALPLFLIAVWLLVPASGSQASYYATTTGNFDTIYLKDGSCITLAGNSAITVTESDTGSFVNLHQGECFFEIQKQKKQPFHVFTTDTKTTVVGTAFTVSKPDSTKPAEIRLKEGIVQVAAFDQSTILHPGERFFWRDSQQSFSTDSISSDAIGNWNAERIVWDKLNIRQIKYQLENSFAINIRANAEVLAQNHQYSLSFNRSISIENLLEILSAITREEKLVFQLDAKQQELIIKK